LSAEVSRVGISIKFRWPCGPEIIRRPYRPKENPASKYQCQKYLHYFQKRYFVNGLRWRPHGRGAGHCVTIHDYNSMFQLYFALLCFGAPALRMAFLLIGLIWTEWHASCHPSVSKIASFMLPPLWQDSDMQFFIFLLASEFSDDMHNLFFKLFFLLQFAHLVNSP
jgi:hypothetical protein